MNPQAPDKLDYYDGLLHELCGHGEHAIHIDRNLPVEFIAFDDITISEGFGFLFDSLSSNKYM